VKIVAAPASGAAGKNTKSDIIITKQVSCRIPVFVMERTPEKKPEKDYSRVVS
jgi:hypothetical protein